MSTHARPRPSFNDLTLNVRLYKEFVLGLSAVECTLHETLCVLEFPAYLPGKDSIGDFSWKEKRVFHLKKKNRLFGRTNRFALFTLFCCIDALTDVYWNGKLWLSNHVLTLYVQLVYTYKMVSNYPRFYAAEGKKAEIRPLSLSFTGNYHRNKGLLKEK